MLDAGHGRGVDSGACGTTRFAVVTRAPATAARLWPASRCAAASDRSLNRAPRSSAIQISSLTEGCAVLLVAGTDLFFLQEQIDGDSLRELGCLVIWRCTLPIGKERSCWIASGAWPGSCLCLTAPAKLLHSVRLARARPGTGSKTLRQLCVATWATSPVGRRGKQEGDRRDERED